MKSHPIKSAQTIAGVCLLTATIALAQDDSTSQQQTNRQSEGSAGSQSEASKQELKISDQEVKKRVTDINKASKLMGMEVRNKQDEKLGKISDLVVDLESGRVAYAALNTGGALNIGGKLIAVPIEAFTAQPGDDYLIINADKESLNQAKGFAKNDWPDIDQVQGQKTFGLSATGRSSEGSEQSQSSRSSSSQEDTGSSASSSTNAFSSSSDTNTSSSSSSAQGAAESPQSSSSGQQSGTSGTISSLQELKSGNATGLQGRQVDISRAKVQDVHGERFVVFAHPDGTQVLARSSDDLPGSIKPGDSVRLSGTVRSAPSNLRDLGLEQSAADDLTGQKIYIEAIEIRSAE